MNYIRLSTKEYPLHEGDIRLEFPNMGKDFVLPPDFAEVFIDPQPEFDLETERFVPAKPVLINGVWRQRWNFRPPYYEEEKYRGHMDGTPENVRLSVLQMKAESEVSKATGEALKAWQEYQTALNAYIDSWPRIGNAPIPPMFDENGNVMTLNSAGSAPNVIG